MESRLHVSLIAVTLAAGLWLTMPAKAATFFFSTGSPDGKIGALTRPASPGKIETETADDFILSETTVINRATFTGLLTGGSTVANIGRVEIELYHIFPLDSDTTRTPAVPSRTNSPADVEIATFTRDSSPGTLHFTSTVLNGSFSVLNHVAHGINKSPNQHTGGEGPASGEEVEISVTFTPPLFMPTGHYFFRPAVLVNGSIMQNFLYLSAPRPTSPPLFVGDLQAWIRDSDLAPDWLRIGSDIVGTPAAGPTFNMTFSLTGDTVPEAGTPGKPNCLGKTVSALANEFGSGLHGASLDLGYASVDALQEALNTFCR